MQNNVRGFKSKEVMIRRIVLEENPVIVALSETKLTKDDPDIKIPGYLSPRVDRDEEGGGVMMMYKESLDHIMVEVARYKLHQAEMLWHRLDNGKIQMKIGVVYMPQESRTSLAKLKEIYQSMEKEIADTRLKGESILIMGDLNCKVGEMINGNKAEVTKGGRLLIKMMKRFKLKLVNAEECCKGVWTRIEGTQRSVLDYLIVFEEDIRLFDKMEIDEAKDITPYYVEKNGDQVERTYTDHCMISATMNIKSIEQKSRTYAMVLDADGKMRYQEALKKEKVSSLITNEDIRVTYPKWRKE